MFNRELFYNHWKFSLFICIVLAIAAGLLTNYVDYEQRNLVVFVGNWKTLQYIVSYQEFEFVKRGLIGSVVQFLPIQPISLAIELTAWTSLLIVCLSLFYFFSKNYKHLSKLDYRVLLLIILSPALMHYGYDIGRFDHFNLVILLFSILSFSNGRIGTSVALQVVGVAIHEAYFFIFFPFFVLFVVASEDPRANIRYLAMVVSVVGVVTLAFGVFGKIEDIEHLCAKSEAVLGYCSDSAMEVWRRGTRDYFETTLSYYGSRPTHYFIQLASGIVYWALSINLAMQISPNLHRFRLWVWLIALAPFALSIATIDVFRWIAIAVLNIWIVSLALGVRSENGIMAVKSPSVIFLLLPFSILGPLGITISSPLLRTLKAYLF